MGEVVPDQRGAAFDGVPKNKNKETDVERIRRERLELKAREKQRIINARTNGLSISLDADKINDDNKAGKVSISLKTASC